MEDKRTRAYQALQFLRDELLAAPGEYLLDILDHDPGCPTRDKAQLMMDIAGVSLLDLCTAAERRDG